MSEKGLYLDWIPYTDAFLEAVDEMLNDIILDLKLYFENPTKKQEWKSIVNGEINKNWSSLWGYRTDPAPDQQHLFQSIWTVLSHGLTALRDEYRQPPRPDLYGLTIIEHLFNIALKAQERILDIANTIIEETTLTGAPRQTISL